MQCNEHVSACFYYKALHTMQQFLLQDLTYNYMHYTPLHVRDLVTCNYMLLHDHYTVMQWHVMTKFCHVITRCYMLM